MKTAKSTSTPVIFTTYDIGRMTGTDPTTVHKWIDKGLLRGYRTPGGHRRVRAEDLRSFLASHQMPIPRELGAAGQLKVMLVDPEPDSLKATARALKRLKPGWELETAESGVDALLRFAAGLPDVLVYDLGVADADGLALFRHLQMRAETARVKRVAVCSRWSGELEKRALDSGAASLLRKPLVGQELVMAIELATGERLSVELA